jgi:hypothetical protein
MEQKKDVEEKSSNLQSLSKTQREALKNKKNKIL